jgi:hypothetical protein
LLPSKPSSVKWSRSPPPHPRYPFSPHRYHRNHYYPPCPTSPPEVHSANPARPRPDPASEHLDLLRILASTLALIRMLASARVYPLCAQIRLRSRAPCRRLRRCIMARRPLCLRDPAPALGIDSPVLRLELLSSDDAGGGGYGVATPSLLTGFGSAIIWQAFMS